MPPDSTESARARMVDDQLRGRDIVDQRVLEAMERVPRELFVPERERLRAHEDAALPIGHGQTISQPYMVARICEALALGGHERVLDVGTGSGYQAAVLAELAGEVFTIERIPELARQARLNLAAAGYDRVERARGRRHSSVSPRTRPSTRSRSRLPRRACRSGSTSSSNRAGGSPSRSAGAGGQRLELIIRSPEGPAIVRSVPCRFVPLVGEGGFPR